MRGAVIFKGQNAWVRAALTRIAGGRVRWSQTTFPKHLHSMKACNHLIFSAIESYIKDTASVPFCEATVHETEIVYTDHFT
jgi:hypothetical protein